MERLSDLLGRRPAEQPAEQRAAEPHFSVLDVGSAAVKALVVSTRGERPTLLSYAAEALAARAEDATVLRAAERALVRAEDGAGIVPRQVVVGIGAPACVVASSEKDARQRLAAERGASPALTRLPDGAFAISSEVDRLRGLVTALDLDLSHLIALPAAMAACLEDGLIVDVGGTTTAVIVARGGQVGAALALPIGGAALEERLRDRLSLGEGDSRQAVQAHAAGAGNRSSAGLAAGRTIGELARHHADVWIDALETGLAELTRGRSLPSAVLLCGGGAGLPELRAALDGRAWASALPFESQPEVRLLGVRDVQGIEVPAALGLGAEAVPSVCLASVAARL